MHTRYSRMLCCSNWILVKSWKIVSEKFFSPMKCNFFQKSSPIQNYGITIAKLSHMDNGESLCYRLIISDYPKSHDVEAISTNVLSHCFGKALTGHFAWICGGTKCIRGPWRHLMVHVRRFPPASNSWNLQFLLRTVRWSWYCPWLVKAFWKRHRLGSLFARFDLLCVFGCYLGDQVCQQYQQNTAELEERIPVACECISTISLARASVNFSLRLWHVATARVKYMWNIVI